jgi:hypothetical protein
MWWTIYRDVQSVIQDFEFGAVLKYEWGSGSAEPGALCARRAWRSHAGVGAGGVAPSRRGGPGYHPRKNLGLLHAKS